MKVLKLFFMTCLIGVTMATANDAVKVMSEFYKVADAKPFDAQKLKQFISNEYMDYDGEHGKQMKNSSYMIEFFEALSKGSSNGYHDITFIKPVDNNKALVRWRNKGTHDGNFFGEFPPTGNNIDIAGMELWEVKDGKIIGVWHVEELHKFFEQLSSK